MVVISRQGPFGADKSVQISQAVFFIKGHNPNLDAKKAKLPFKSGYPIFFMPGSFGFKLSEDYNIALRSVHSQPEKNCPVVLTFKSQTRVPRGLFFHSK